MSGITNSYGAVATIPQFGVSARVVLASTGLYTCPANKKAKASGSMQLIAVGVDATYCIAVKRGASYHPVGKFVVAGGESFITGVVVMDATDILTNIGDSGSTNGTTDMDASIQEVTV